MLQKIKSLVQGFIDNNNSAKNSKLITSLFFSTLMAITAGLILADVPPQGSAYVSSWINVCAILILAPLGINGWEGMRSK